MFVDLSKKKVMIIGGGKIGKRRAKVLNTFTNDLTVITKECDEELKELGEAYGFSIIEKEFQQEDIYEADLVLAATDDEIMNNRIYAVCKSLGIVVNVCSDKSKCDFYFPGTILTKEGVIGVTANGKDHKKAKELTERIRRIL